MKLGFIGTGEITKALVIGILGSKIKFKKIYLSKRNSKISAFLTKKSKKVQIEKNNQFLINKSDWVFLAVTPKVGNQIIGKLHFKKKQVIISFISTIQLKKLKELTKNNQDIVRAIPLPPISLRKGPIPIFPQFINFESNYVIQFLILITTYVVLDFLSLICYAILANKLIDWLKANPKTINTISACVLLFIGIFIALTQQY